MGIEWFIGFVVVTMGGGWLIRHYSEAEKIKRTLRAAARWPLAELPENTQGRVVGRARASDETLTAPITGRACAYYIVEVVQVMDDSRSTLFVESRGVPFLIEDETGRALVDPEGARITLDFDRETQSDRDDPPSREEQTLLARHDHNDAKPLDSRLIYRESVIAIGEQVAVLGSGIREPDPDAAPTADYRGALPTRLRLTSSSRFPLVISDYPATVGA